MKDRANCKLDAATSLLRTSASVWKCGAKVTQGNWPICSATSIFIRRGVSPVIVVKFAGADQRAQRGVSARLPLPGARNQNQGLSE